MPVLWALTGEGAETRTTGGYSTLTASCQVSYLDEVRQAWYGFCSIQDDSTGESYSLGPLVSLDNAYESKSATMSLPTDRPYSLCVGAQNYQRNGYPDLMFETCAHFSRGV